MRGQEHQSSISRYFKPNQPNTRPSAIHTPKKRPSSPVDLTVGDEEDNTTQTSHSGVEIIRPPSKRLRVPPDTSISGSLPVPARDSISRVHCVNRPKPNIKGDPSTPWNELLRGGDARRKWALGSEVEPEQVSKRDMELRTARRNAYASKLSSHFGARNRTIWEAGTEGTQESVRPLLADDEPDVDESAEFDDEDTERLSRSSRKGLGTKSKENTKALVGPSGQPWTPLEKQILGLKNQYPGVLLMVEVGYKFRFFGEDARIASRVLGIACFPNRNFLSASVPVHRRNVHVRRLISQGYKVGIIGQAETAALKKVSDNRGGPFVRKLTELYTSATYVDDMNSADDLGMEAPSSSNSLMCLVEHLGGGMGSDERVTIGMVSIDPSTGDLVYDEFPDTHMRTELETRLTHIRPCEMLLPRESLSSVTKRMVSHLKEIPGTQVGEVRIEEFELQMGYSDAFEYLNNVFGAHSSDSPPTSGTSMAVVVNLPRTVVVALAHTLQHLAVFGLTDSFMDASLFTKFTDRSHMLLNANTLINLSAFSRLSWILKDSNFNLLFQNKTITRFGARLLRSWISKPLIDKDILQQRVDAVEEVLQSHSHTLDKLRIVLRGLPDLVKGLARIHYGKSRPKELSVILEAYERIGSALQTSAAQEDVGLMSPLLQDIASSLPRVREPIQALLGTINVRKASMEEKSELWRDESKYPAIRNAKAGIRRIEQALEDELKQLRKTLRRPSIQYVTVGQDEYLVEVPTTSLKEVPVTWSRVSSTRKVTRFHSPEVRRMLAERDQHKETLAAGAESEKAYLHFLAEVSVHYPALRDATNKLAIFDCLNSLALVAGEVGYIKPQLVDSDIIDVVGGRHPMAEALRSDPFVPNDIALGGGQPRHKIITGPNMGGKSSVVRMAALITIMAQIGSYVPAKSARLGMHDAILTRMGAYDELTKGRSTFMVEMSETSDILKTCTPRTLVILDELGRGTSTFDGVSIAYAVLKHLVESAGCKTLFITHYPLLASEMARLHREVANEHMSFVEESVANGTTTVNFLYRLTPGMAKSSYGIECAMLAGLPDEVLEKAKARSIAIEDMIGRRQRSHKLQVTMKVVQNLISETHPSDGTHEGLRQLKLLRGRALY